MRILLILLLVGGTAFVAWTLLGDPAADEAGQLPVDDELPNAPRVEVPFRHEEAPSQPEVPRGSTARIAVLRPGEELPAPELLLEPVREIRFGGERGALSGARILEVVAKGMFVRAVTSDALRALETVEVPEHWSDPELLLPIEEVFELWRHAGVEVGDNGHVIVVERVPGAGGR